MKNKTLLTPQDLRLYVVTFEFFNGRRSTCFRKSFYATNEKELKRHIDKYLLDYGVKSFPHSENVLYCYSDTDLSVNLLYWEEITGYEQLGL